MVSLTTTTTIIFPLTSHFNFHPKLHSSHSLTPSSLLHFHPPRYRFRIGVCRAIRNPRFDFNLRSSNDDGDVRGRRRYSRGRKSGRRSKQRRWWTNDDDDDEDEDEDVELQKGVWEEVVDSLWILQVFRAYGWFSPIILLSFLIATGPKAFLMAFSIPFGISLLIFAYEKLQGWLEGSPKARNRRKRKSKFGRRNYAFMEEEGGEEEEEEEEEEESQPSQRNKTKDYQSPWVNQSNGSFYKSQNGSGASGKNFGGWDDLVRDDETQHIRREPSGETVKPEKLVEKLSRPLEEKELPVILRLLIAVFPFLASWTDLL